MIHVLIWITPLNTATKLAQVVQCHFLHIIVMPENENTFTRFDNCAAKWIVSSWSQSNNSVTSCHKGTKPCTACEFICTLLTAQSAFGIKHVELDSTYEHVQTLLWVLLNIWQYTKLQS